MEINTRKIKTYIGFAIKSRKIKFGVDDIIKLKNAELIIVSDSLAESGVKKINGFAEEKNIDLINLKEEIFLEVVPNYNIKVTAIVDKNLADAIKKNLTIN